MNKFNAPAIGVVTSEGWHRYSRNPKISRVGYFEHSGGGISFYLATTCGDEATVTLVRSERVGRAQQAVEGTLRSRHCSLEAAVEWAERTALVGN